MAQPKVYLSNIRYNVTDMQLEAFAGGHPGWMAISTGGGGGGGPAGSNTQVQFNNIGNFGASPSFTYDDSSTTLAIPGGTINIGNGTFRGSNLYSQTGVQRFFIDSGILLDGSGNNVLESDSRTLRNPAGQAAIHWGLSGRVGIGTDNPVASAALEISSTTRGFLPPRLSTAQKTGISSPAEGLMVYDTTLKKLCVWTGVAWETITSV